VKPQGKPLGAGAALVGPGGGWERGPPFPCPQPCASQQRLPKWPRAHCWTLGLQRGFLHCEPPEKHLLWVSCSYAGVSQTDLPLWAQLLGARAARESQKDVSTLWFFTAVENLSVVTARLQSVCLWSFACRVPHCAGARLATTETPSWDQATTAAPALALMAPRVDASLPAAVTRIRSRCKSCVSVAWDT